MLLIIGVQLEEMANMLFNQGLFLKSNHYLVIRYKTIFLVTQYFKCQGFNYIAKSCRKEDRYKHYTRQYNTSNCTGDPPKKYINCKADYKAWSKAYSIKQTQQEKAVTIKAFTLIHYTSAYKAPISTQ